MSDLEFDFLGKEGLTKLIENFKKTSDAAQTIKHDGSNYISGRLAFNADTIKSASTWFINSYNLYASNVPSDGVGYDSPAIGRLSVIEVGDGTVQQFFEAYYGFYHRTYNSNKDTWSSWSRMVEEVDIEDLQSLPKYPPSKNLCNLMIPDISGYDVKVTQNPEDLSYTIVYGTGIPTPSTKPVISEWHEVEVGSLSLPAGKYYISFVDLLGNAPSDKILGFERSSNRYDIKTMPENPLAYNEEFEFESFGVPVKYSFWYIGARDCTVKAGLLIRHIEDLDPSYVPYKLISLPKGGGNATARELTYAEYLAGLEDGSITTDDGIDYYVTDFGYPVLIVPITQAEYDLKGESVNSDGVLYIITDAPDEYIPSQAVDLPSYEAYEQGLADGTITESDNRDYYIPDEPDEMYPNSYQVDHGDSTVGDVLDKHEEEIANKLTVGMQTNVEMVVQNSSVTFTNGNGQVTVDTKGKNLLGIAFAQPYDTGSIVVTGIRKTASNVLSLRARISNSTTEYSGTIQAMNIMYFLY